MDNDKIECEDEELCADSLSNCDDEVIDDDSSDDDIIYRSRTIIRRISSGFDSSPDSDDSDSQEEWSSVDKPPVLEEFLGRSGINTENVPDSVADAVALFIGDDFLFLVEESNRYDYRNIDKFITSKKALKLRKTLRYET